MGTATEKLTMWAQRKSKINAALDECGIGADFDERFNRGMERIAKFCASVQARTAAQLLHNVKMNEPLGEMSRSESYDGHAHQAMLAGTVGALGELIGWRLSGARDLAADILDDRNAHKEAALVRAMSMD